MYSTPMTMTISYNYGVLSGTAFIVQVASGIIIAFSYAASAEYAFTLLDHTNRDSTYGWMIRSVHANSASVVFGCMYLHVCRSFLYSVLLRVYMLVWLSGLFLWLAMMGIAFMGYVLP